MAFASEEPQERAFLVCHCDFHKISVKLFIFSLSLQYIDCYQRLFISRGPTIPRQHISSYCNRTFKQEWKIHYFLLLFYFYKHFISSNPTFYVYICRQFNFYFLLTAICEQQKSKLTTALVAGGELDKSGSGPGSN